MCATARNWCQINQAAETNSCAGTDRIIALGETRTGNLSDKSNIGDIAATLTATVVHICSLATLIGAEIENAHIGNELQQLNCNCISLKYARIILNRKTVINYHG